MNQYSCKLLCLPDRLRRCYEQLSRKFQVMIAQARCVKLVSRDVRSWSSAQSSGSIMPYRGDTQLFIRPGFLMTTNYACIFYVFLILISSKIFFLMIKFITTGVLCFDVFFGLLLDSSLDVLML